MCERMLDKQVVPTVEEMTAYRGVSGGAFTEVNAWIDSTFDSDPSIVFPYGNSCGWGIAHRKKKKLLCSMFPENGSFCVMVRLYNAEFQSVYDQAGDCAKNLIDNNSRAPKADGSIFGYSQRKR